MKLKLDLGKLFKSETFYVTRAPGTLCRFLEQIKLFLEAIFVILGRPQSKETAYDIRSSRNLALICEFLRNQKIIP